MNYIAYLHKEANSDYGVSFPDFPGCVTAGRSFEEASRRAPEALSLHISGMLKDGEAIPDPSTLDEVYKDPARKHAMVILVNSRKVDETVRINITARVSQLKQIDKLADNAGLTRSAYLIRSAIQRREENSSRRRAHAKKMKEARA